MLQPLQLEEVSVRYAREIVELQDFLVKSGMPIDTAEAMSDLVTRLRQDRGFRRDLKSHVWVAVHTSGQQISYSDLLGMLAIAAAGTRFASATDDSNAHDLLRFLMEARSSFEMTAETQKVLPARRFDEPQPAKPLSLAMPEDEDDRRPIVWIGAAACLLLALLFGLFFYHRSAVDHGLASAPITGPAAGTTPAIVSANRDGGNSAQQSETTTPAARRSPRRKLNKQMQRSSRGASEAEVSSEANLSPATPSALVRPVVPTFLGTRAPSAPPAATAKASTTENPKSPRLLRRSPDGAAKSKSNLVAKATPADDSETSGSNPTVSAAHAGFVRSTSLGIMAANVTYSPAPTYPAAASSLHVQGEVKLEAEIDSEGNVVSTRIISGPPLLQEAAADAVQRWHYRPYLYEGKPIGMNATVVMDFQLPSL